MVVDPYDVQRIERICVDWASLGWLVEIVNPAMLHIFSCKCIEDNGSRPRSASCWRLYRSRRTHFTGAAVCDSQYLVNGRNDWQHHWKCKGWRHGKSGSHGSRGPAGHIEQAMLADRVALPLAGTETGINLDLAHHPVLQVVRSHTDFQHLKSLRERWVDPRQYLLPFGTGGHVMRCGDRPASDVRLSKASIPQVASGCQRIVSRPGVMLAVG
nr:hypothetical protein [Mesorhizobium sp. LNHC220B00]